MDIHFVEVSPHEIIKSYPSYFHEKARYFKAIKVDGRLPDDKPLCFYGIISRTEHAGEAFLMMKTFNGKVLSKGFFVSLFHHVFSLGYKEIYTWTKWNRLIELFRRFKRFGIEETGCPPWDKDASKTWFIRKVH